MLRVATRAWGNVSYEVIGLTHTAVAADVLRSEARMPAETVAKFFDWYDHQPPAGWALTPATSWSSTRRACSPPEI